MKVALFFGVHRNWLSTPSSQLFRQMIFLLSVFLIWYCMWPPWRIEIPLMTIPGPIYPIKSSCLSRTTAAGSSNTKWQNTVMRFSATSCWKKRFQTFQPSKGSLCPRRLGWKGKSWSKTNVFGQVGSRTQLFPFIFSMMTVSSSQQAKRPVPILLFLFIAGFF